MLRTNLSTRPFYNERAVHAGVATAGLLVLALTAFNVGRIVSLSRHNTDLAGRTGGEQAEATRLTAEAAAIRKTINKDELDIVVAAAREANALIDQRTFSWTEFFNQIESTLPPDVMVTAVRPAVHDGQTNVTMIVLGKRTEDIDEFMEQLEATGAFEQIIPAQGDRTEDGTYRAVIQSVYTAAPPDDAAEAKKGDAAGGNTANGAAPGDKAAPAPETGKVGEAPKGRGGRP